MSAATLCFDLDGTLVDSEPGSAPPRERAAACAAADLHTVPHCL